MKAHSLYHFAILLLLSGFLIKAQGGIPDEVHPGFDMEEIQLRTTDNILVGGMKFLDDGRMVLATLRSQQGPPSRNDLANVYLVSGLTDNTDVSMEQIATDFRSIHGVEVIGDSIIVSDWEGVFMLVDEDGDDIIDEKQEVLAVPGGLSWHEFLFTPVYTNGKLYVAYSATIGGNNPATHELNGCVLEIDEQGNASAFSSGFRTPNGMGKNALGELFVTDNQGEWLPTSTFTHAREGTTNGFQHLPAKDNEKWDYKPPTAWLPHSKASRSATEPVVFPDGPYKDQFLYGDANFRNLFRIYLDEVNGDYQGAVFPFSAAMNESAVIRLVWGPEGSLYAGTDGVNGNWPQAAEIRPMYKMTPNSQTAFEVLSVHSRSEGLELKFTKPVNTSGQNQWNFTVNQWEYTRTNNYGGPEQNRQTRNTGDPQVSGDGLSIYLPINNMQTGGATHVQYSGITSAQGNEELWNDEFWYTLNNISDSNPFDPVQVKKAEGELSPALKFAGRFLRVSTQGFHSVTLHDLAGKFLKAFKGTGTKTYSLPHSHPGIVLVTVKSQGPTSTHRIILP